MTSRERQIRIGILIGAHLLLGLIMALTALGYPMMRNSWWTSVLFMSLVCSDILLLGMWVGLTAAPWWIKLASLLIGLAWLECLCLAPAPRMNAQDYLLVLAMVALPVLVVAGSCLLYRRWIARIEYQNFWESRRLAEELQFTLKSMIGLTITIAVILALGRFVHWVEPRMQGAVLPFIFALTALLGAGMLMWAALGPGQIMVRLPIMLVGMTLLGLLPPYYMGDGPSYRFFMWPALTALIAGCTTASLLIIRSCGYRLVSINGVAVGSCIPVRLSRRTQRPPANANSDQSVPDRDRESGPKL